WIESLVALVQCRRVDNVVQCLHLDRGEIDNVYEGQCKKLAHFFGPAVVAHDARWHAVLQGHHVAVESVAEYEIIAADCVDPICHAEEYPHVPAGPVTHLRIICDATKETANLIQCRSRGFGWRVIGQPYFRVLALGDEICVPGNPFAVDLANDFEHLDRVERVHDHVA